MSSTNLTAQVTSDVVTALGAVCDLEGEVREAFSQTISGVLSKYHLATEAPSEAVAADGDSDGTVKVQLKKKKKKRDTSHRKPSKNAYHFFVAAKMPEVKASGVESKQRMKQIGLMWGKTDADGKAPFNAAAKTFNEKVAEMTATEGWVKADVAAAAQAVAVLALGDAAPVAAPVAVVAAEASTTSA